MTIGMLWFDNSKRPLRVKIEEAAKYYQEKYGRKPNCCFVSAKAVVAEGDAPDGMRVEATRQVLAHHLWIGVDEEIHHRDTERTEKIN